MVEKLLIQHEKIMPTKLPPWKEFVDSGKFNAVEKKPIKVGDHVITKEDDINKLVRAVDSTNEQATIFDGGKEYEYPIEDIRHTKDVTEATFKDLSVVGRYEKKGEQKGTLKWVKDFGVNKGHGRTH